MTALLSAFRLSLTSILRNKLRTSLTMLGILIGVAAVVVTTALGAGARAQINSQIESLGSNVLLVFPQPNQMSGARGGQGNPWLRLIEDDAKAIMRSSTSIAGAGARRRESESQRFVIRDRIGLSCRQGMGERRPRRRHVRVGPSCDLGFTLLE